MFSNRQLDMLRDFEKVIYTSYFQDNCEDDAMFIDLEGLLTPKAFEQIEIIMGERNEDGCYDDET